MHVRDVVLDSRLLGRRLSVSILNLSTSLQQRRDSVAIYTCHQAMLVKHILVE